MRNECLQYYKGIGIDSEEFNTMRKECLVLRIIIEFGKVIWKEMTEAKFKCRKHPR